MPGSNAARQRKQRIANRRKGKPSQAEHRAVESLIQDTHMPDEAIAAVLRRDVKTVRGWIAAARERLHGRAERYVDIHMQATEGALAGEDFATAGRLAFEAISALTDKTETGRVISPPPRDVAAPGSGVTVQIGVALGGVKALTAGEIVDVEPIA